MERRTQLRSQADGASARPWPDEKRSVMAKFHVEGSAFSVARQFCDGGRRDGPPLAPLSKGGEVGATFAAGNLHSLSLSFTFSSAQPGPLPRGEGAIEIAPAFSLVP